jgi:radical SAM superfamily enzyme YgiQ (UPF0313 family)
MADIVLINPRFSPSYWGLNYAMPFLDATAVLPPINLPLLAALTPPKHNVTLIDENVEEIDFDRCSRADIVGITGMNVQRKRMHEILAELKRRGVFTVIGGSWVTVYPEDFEDLASVIFIGEAEETWPQFLAEWAEGRHHSRYEQADKTDLATVPAPRLDLLPMGKYAYGSVQITRGCPFTCEFCDIIIVFGRRPRAKTAAQVIAELEGLVAAGKYDAFIVDDNLIGNKKAIKPILREIIAWQEANGYPLSFATEASIDLAEDEELMQLMVAANIDTVFVGIESPNEAALRETKKVQNLADRSGTMLEKVHRIQAAGMEVWSGMIVGFDNDDEGVFELQRRFIQEARIVQAMVNILVAIPKTPLYARLQNEGRLDNSGEMANFGTISTNVIPLRIGRRALCSGYLDLMRDLYAPDAYFSRMDALYLEGKLRPDSGRARYLRRRPWRWLKSRVGAALEGVFVFVQLMRLVPDAALRREYRRRLWNAVKRRPQVTLLRLYCIKCALHFHYHQLVRQLVADRVTLATQADVAGRELILDGVERSSREEIKRAAAHLH